MVPNRDSRCVYRRPTALSCLLLILFSATAFGQSATATLSGVVIDESNAVIRDVTVTVLSRHTGFQRENSTDERGQFTFVALQPGRYMVRATRQGFTPVEVPDLTLNVNDSISIKLQLKVEKVGEEVTVIAEPSRVNMSPSVGTTVDRDFVANLPLNGRSFQSLIALTPGVLVTAANLASPGQFSVSGQRTNANYLTVDGVSGNVGVTTDPNFAFAPGQEAAGTTPALNAFGGTQGLIAVDALEEFKIQTSSYSAEFGRQPGGQIILASRSGTNVLHSSAAYFFRDDALDATDWFTNRDRLPRAELHQHQFAAVLGGPVKLPGYDGRNRSFFFVSYEGLDAAIPRTVTIDVPSRAIRQLAAPAVRPLMNIWPMPTGPDDLVTHRARFESAYSDTNTAHSTSLRLDHALTPGTRLFGRYNYSPSSSVTRASTASTRLEARPLFHWAMVGATQVLGHHATHDIRFNYSRNDGDGGFVLDDFGGAVPIDPASVLPAGTPKPEAGLFQFITYTGAVGISYGRAQRQHQFNIVDTVTWVRPRHMIKFGIDYREMRPSYDPWGTWMSLSFATPQSVMSGLLNGGLIQQQDRADMLFRNFSAYAQDTWTPVPRVTIDAGLRWDVNPAPRATNGRDFFTVVGLENLATMQVAPAGSALYPTQFNGLAPRLGAAVQLSMREGWERTLRGGFGVYYDIGAGVAGRAADYFPFTRRRTFTANTPFPLDAVSGAAPPPLSTNPPFANQNFIAFPDHTLPRTYQWNVALQQALGRSESVSATYVGALGRKLLVRESILTPNPNFTGTSMIDLSRGTGTSSYHALQLQYQRRLSRGLQALAGYTLSEAEDTVSSDSLSLPRTDLLDPEENRGPADYDVRHGLAAAVVYIVPRPANRALAAVFGGWSFDAILRAQSAPPVDVFVVRNFGFGAFSARPDRVEGVPVYLDDPSAPGGRRFNPEAFTVPVQNRQGTLGRNALRGFPLRQMDFSVNRRFDARRAKIELRGDLFNVFNTVSFASPNGRMGTATGSTFVPDSTFGRSTALWSARLGGLSRLYQVGGPRSIQLSARVSF